LKLTIRPRDLWDAMLIGLSAAHSSWRHQSRAPGRHGSSSAKPLTITLSEEAIQLARVSDVVPSAPVMVKILGSPIDVSFGNERLCRHVTLTLAEAERLHDYYRRFADAFAKIGDKHRALICAKARATIRLALWKAELSKFY
jgi:hypothetical protein